MASALDRLELRLPPLALVVLCAAAMWATPAPLAFPLAASHTLLLAVMLGLLGGGICLSAVLSFRLARTTVKPTAPEAASALVIVGIYRYTRNPMYLGFLLMLAGWAVFLANPLAGAALPCFVLYLNRFQIAPEERALWQRFGEAYAAYQGRVRRWL